MRPLSRPALAGVLTARMTIMLAIACVIGVTASALTYLAFHSLPQALLAAGAATGSSTGLLNQIIGAGQHPASGQENDQHDDQATASGCGKT